MRMHRINLLLTYSARLPIDIQGHGADKESCTKTSVPPRLGHLATAMGVQSRCAIIYFLSPLCTGKTSAPRVASFVFLQSFFTRRFAFIDHVFSCCFSALLLHTRCCS
jgi:hypothetical protein